MFVKSYLKLFGIINIDKFKCRRRRGTTTAKASSDLSLKAASAMSRTGTRHMMIVRGKRREPRGSSLTSSTRTAAKVPKDKEMPIRASVAKMAAAKINETMMSMMTQ